MSGIVVAGPVADAAGFQGSDGNLVDDAAGIDWNSFASVDYGATGAPYRQADKDFGGWHFTGVEDAAALTTDTAFAGGVKQDANCPIISGNKAPNKDDLKRAYFADAKVGGDVFLALAWVRIQQNTTNASAHVGFEFNQGDTPCGTASDGLVQRTAGDLLFVYDFEGSSTDAPHITVRTWVTSPAGKGNCEISSNSTPCWGIATDLTTAGFAEAKVNTNPGPGESLIADDLAPTAGGTSTTEQLGTNEFGEAIVNLSEAIDAIGGDNCVAFGKAFAVSRSSGNSGTAQMKDLAGPGTVDIRTCGGIIIRKVTDPSPDPNDTSFGFTADPDPTDGVDTDTFSLKNGGSKSYEDVQNGLYTVTENDPSPTYALTSIDCSASSISSGSTATVSLGDLKVDIDLKGEDTIDCTFTNTLQTGALEILKNSTKGGAVANAGAVFSYDSSSVTDNGTGDEDLTVGVVCVSGLTPGGYTVNETSAPSGYGDAPASEADQDVTVVAGTNCDDNLPGAGATATFTNAPLYDLQVNFRDGGSGETSATITCSLDPADSSTAPSGWTTSKTYTGREAPATVTCTIEVDP